MRLLFLALLTLSANSFAALQVIPKPTEGIYKVHVDWNILGYVQNPQDAVSVYSPSIGHKDKFYETSMSHAYLKMPYVYGVWVTGDVTRHHAISKVTFTDESHCPVTHPIDNGDGTCSGEAPPTQCPESGTSFKNLNGRSGLEGYSTCVSSNCVVALTAPDLQLCTGADTQESCPYTATYTGQTCDSSANAGIKPPDYQWPSVTIPDNGVTDPDAPSLPTDRPDGGSGGSNGGGNVTDGDIKPNPEPAPTPDNPNFSEADNALLAEQSLTTQHVENIEYSVDQLRQETSDNAVLKTEYDKRILGELESLNGSGQLGDSELKQSLDAIGCALDPKLCADGNGDGGGDGNGEGGNGVVADGCATFSCNGDAVACYLAEQQWREQCGKDFFDQGTDQEIQKGLDEFINDNPVELIEAGELDISNVLNKYQGRNGIEIKGGCPSPQRFEVMGKSYQVDFKPFCDLAGIIKVLLMAFTLVSCGLLIAKYGL